MPASLLTGSRDHRVPRLDGFRGVAVLLVVASHVLSYGLGLPGAGLGGLGVMLFFVLSGYLITGLLDRERAEAGRIAPGRFYLRRAFRLFPAFFLFIAVVCALAWAHYVNDTSRATVLACVLYYRNLAGGGATTGHIWTLSMEEQFYLLWPLAMICLRPRRALQAALAGIVAISAFRMIAIYFDLWLWETGVFYSRPWFRFDSLLIGCAIWLWLRDGTPRAAALLGNPVAPAILWPAAVVWSVWFEQIEPELHITVQMLLAAALLLHLLVAKNKPYLAVLSNPVARWFGRVSYSWYLWQQLFLVFPPPGWHGLRAFPLSVLASLAIAAASYYGVERPFLCLRDRVVRERPRLAAVPGR